MSSASRLTQPPTVTPRALPGSSVSAVGEVSVITDAGSNSVRRRCSAVGSSLTNEWAATMGACSVATPSWVAKASCSAVTSLKPASTLGSVSLIDDQSSRSRMRWTPYPPRAQRIPATDESSHADCRSAARSESVPARYSNRSCTSLTWGATTTSSPQPRRIAQPLSSRSFGTGPLGATTATRFPEASRRGRVSSGTDTALLSATCRSTPGQRQRRDAGRFESEHLAVQGQLGLERCHHRLPLAEPVLLAVEREVGMRDAASGDAVEETLALRRWADLVLQALHEQERNGEHVGPVDRRTLLVALPCLWPRPHQALEVPRLEVVRLTGPPPGQVQERVQNGAAREVVDGGQRRRSRRAAGAAAPDRQPARVGRPLMHQCPCHGRAVLDVDDPPALPQPVPVLATMSGGAAVVHLDDADAPAGEEGDLQVVDHRRPAGRTAVDEDDVGRKLPVRCDEVRVARRIEVGMDLPRVEGAEGAGLGLGQVGRLEPFVGGRGQRSPFARTRVDLDDLEWPVRSAGQADDRPM